MKIISFQDKLRAAALLVSIAACSVSADRVETRLVEWTCDGERVNVPHTWNAVDGADGHGTEFQDFDNSVAGRGFVRCCKTYLRTLPPPRRQASDISFDVMVRR